MKSSEIMNMAKGWLFKKMAGEAGQALPIVLILLALGSLLIVPALDYVSTGLKAGGILEKKMKGLYAADAGVEDGLWRLLNEKPASFPYSYQLTGINGMTVDVTISEVTTISGEEIEYPGGHSDSLGVEPAVAYAAGIYDYTIYLTNKCVSNIKIEKILVALPGGLDYIDGSTTGDMTTEDPLVTGSSETGITLVWDILPPLPNIEPGPDPGEGEYNTESHMFQLSGEAGISGVAGHGFVEASREDVGTIWVGDCFPYAIVAQAKDATNAKVATIRAGAWESGYLNISCWQVNP